MHTGYSGYLHQRLMTSSTSKLAASGNDALARHQFGTSRALHRRVQSHGVKTAKQRLARLHVTALKDLPLPAILDRDFDKEGSRVYKRTVHSRSVTQKRRNTL